jgi:hypothetical protein
LKKAYTVFEWLIVLIFLIGITSFILPNLSKTQGEKLSFFECHQDESNNKKCFFSRDLVIKSKELSNSIIKKFKKIKDDEE